METSTKIGIGFLITIIALVWTFIGVLIPKNTDFEPITEKTIYLEKECKPQLCEENNFDIIDNSRSISPNNLLFAKVFGTIYEDNELVNILGTCSDENNHPKLTNATITIYYPNTSVFINRSNMTSIAEGRFNFSTTTAIRGNFLVEMNCTEGSNYATAYTEFQNPTWTNKIQTAIDNIANLLGQTNKKDFEIDKFIIISPIYPNETIIAEATFSDENGTLIIPDEIGLTILYPNRTLFLNRTKTHFENINNVWNYSEVLVASQKTGTYYAKLEGNFSSKRAIKTTQFRIATGGPYSLRLDCPSAIETGQILICSVQIIDEGEVAVESTTTIWIDQTNNQEPDANESQTSFSKRTEPQDTITELANIGLSSSHPTGIFIVRAKTIYLGSDQPDSTASDTITIIPAPLPAAEGVGATGTSGTTPFKCNKLIIVYNTCYHFDTNQSACIVGCPISSICKDLQCIPKGIEKFQQSIPIKELSLWEKIVNFIKSAFNRSSSLNIEQQDMAITQAEQRIEIIAKAQEIANKPIEQINQHPYMALSIAGIIAIVLAFIQFNMVLFMPPMIFYIIGYYIIIAILWFFKVIG